MNRAIRGVLRRGIRGVVRQDVPGRVRPATIAGTALIALLSGACAPAEESVPGSVASELAAGLEGIAPAELRVAVITGFDGPESVMYDPDQDLWFVSSFTGPSGERDGNGTVSVVDAETMELVDPAFAVGTDAFPFHAGRGMALQGDTLWVADVDGVHAFDRRRGTQLGFVDMTDFEPGFLNDLDTSPDGSLYLTDTGASRVYRIRPGAPEVVAEGGRLASPNGILWDPTRSQFWLAPWDGGDQLRLWDPATGDVTRGPSTPPAGRMDGLVFRDDVLYVASQADSAIHAVSSWRSGPWIRTEGRPADLGLDTRRGRIAIPEVALDQVEIWRIPGG
jgi:DNA-binding beta-propeller fold protein YncE